MRELLLVEPGRRPPDWNEHLREGECAVFLSDVRSDATVNADGHRPPTGMSAVCLVFESRVVAEAWCEARVATIEHLRCDLFDRRGRAVPAMVTVVNPRYAGRLPNRRTARWLVIGAIACFPASAPFFWWDYRADWLLIVPTFLGLSLVAAGVRLLFWALNESVAAQERERQ